MNIQPIDSPFWTAEEAANYCRVSLTTMHELLRRSQSRSRPLSRRGLGRSRSESAMRRMGRGSRYEGIERYDGPKGTRWVAHAAKRRSDGTRKTWQETFDTEKAAASARRRWLTEHEQGYDVQRSRKTVADALESWFATHTPGLAPTTVQGYRTTLDTHLLTSPIAEQYLYYLTTEIVQDWYNSLSVGTRTKELIHLRLCQALDLAVRHHYLARNMARECEVEHSRPRRGVALDPAQVAAFLTQAERDHYHPLWHLALATGMRRGELLGLRWRDVDLDRGMALVSQTNVWLGWPALQDHPKTPASRRAIKLDARSVALLKVHKASQSKRRELAGDA